MSMARCPLLQSFALNSLFSCNGQRTMDNRQPTSYDKHRISITVEPVVPIDGFPVGVQHVITPAKG
jgi:hypothetical protein